MPCLGAAATLLCAGPVGLHLSLSLPACRTVACWTPPTPLAPQAQGTSAHRPSLRDKDLLRLTGPH